MKNSLWEGKEGAPKIADNENMKQYLQYLMQQQTGNRGHQSLTPEKFFFENKILYKDDEIDPLKALLKSLGLFGSLYPKEESNVNEEEQRRLSNQKQRREIEREPGVY